MSHSKERKEKTCLNCQASLIGRYCHQCGQENLEPKETVWHLVTHFFNDITHFDGKFFSTGKFLITRPGFLSLEYMQGRRASYLNPIRMYVFTSAFFFLLFFSLASPDKILNLRTNGSGEDSLQNTRAGLKDWQKQKMSLENEIKNLSDSSDRDQLSSDLDELNAKIAAVKKAYGDTSTRTFSAEEITLLLIRQGVDSVTSKGIPKAITQQMKPTLDLGSPQKNNGGDGIGKFKDVHSYDSVQQTLPESRRDGWFKKMGKRKLIAVNEQWHKDKKGYMEHFKENFMHSFPKIFFFSLPFFALILKLVYIRRKEYYYVDHVIFTLHLYCASFIFLMVLLLLNKLLDVSPQPWLHVTAGILSFGIWIFMFVYLYKAMRCFYKQGRFKTILKYGIVGFLAFFLNLLLMVIFLAVSAISVN